MADIVDKYIPETVGANAKWVDNVYQLDRNDPVLGGTYTGGTSKVGIANRAVGELAQRTQYLKYRTDDMQSAALPKKTLTDKITAEDTYVRSIFRLLYNYGIVLPASYTDYKNVLTDVIGYTYRGQTNDVMPYFSAGVLNNYIVAVNPSPTLDEQNAATFTNKEDASITRKIIYYAAKTGDENRNKPVGIAYIDNAANIQTVITSGFVKVNIAIHPELASQVAEYGGALPKGEIVYLSDKQAGTLTLTETEIPLGICANDNIIFLDPVGFNKGGGSGEVSYEEQDYALLLNESSFKNLYYDTFQEFSVPDDKPSNFPVYNYAESCLEGDGGANPTVYEVTILDSTDNEEAETYKSFSTVVYLKNYSQGSNIKVEYSTDTSDIIEKTWHPVRNLEGATVDQVEGTYTTTTTAGNMYDVYMNVNPFKDLHIRFTWEGANSLLSYGVLYGEEAVVSAATPTMYEEYTFTEEWDGTSNLQVMIPNLKNLEVKLPEDLADPEGEIGTTPTSRPYAYRKDGKSLGVRDSNGKYLVNNVHYKEINGGIELIGYPLQPKLTYMNGDKLIFFGYGGTVDGSLENSAILSEITNDNLDLVVKGYDADGALTGKKYRLYMLEEADGSVKLVHEEIV